jgi:hypothetical protein
MKISLLTCLLAVLAQDSIAWAPASLTSLATRNKVSSSRYHGGALYVAGVVEEPKTSSAFSDDKSQKILGQPIPYSELTIGVIKETFKGENRVSQTPDSIRSLVKAGLTVIVQSGGRL